MKKLRLKALSLGAKEILNRDQLKSIYGGSGTPPPFPCAGDPVNDWCCTCISYPYTFTCPSVTDNFGYQVIDPTCLNNGHSHCNGSQAGCTLSSNYVH